ncbi:MAG: response regulator [bacterium]
MINVAIIEDDHEVCQAIQGYLNDQQEFLCELVEGSVEKFIVKINEDNFPDVILMDIGLPGMSGIDGIKLIKEKFPDIDIIMLTIYDDSHKIFQSLCAGASGYLLKNRPFAEIKQAIEVLYAGGAPMTPQIARKVIEYFQPQKSKNSESPLTDKEREIVIGLVDGLSYKMIADRMFISIETVRTHIKNIYKKLHVHCKAEVISKSLRGEI